MINFENRNIFVLNTTPILTGNCALCLFSIIVNFIEMKIILSLKFLNSILYRLLFFISISEIINCFFHIFQSILNIFDFNSNFLNITNSAAIYFTDTFSIILLACLCDSMNAMILKQNRKISFNRSYMYFSLIFSVVLTIIYYIFFIIKSKEKFIYTQILLWKFFSNENLNNKDIISFASLNFISYLLTIIIYGLIMVYSFILIIKIQIFIKEKNQEGKKKKNSRLNEFRFKMIKYPIYGTFWVLPLMSYSLFEFFKQKSLDPNVEFPEEIKNLRIKYFLFFFYSFISSLRGVLFFKLFISNERIKKQIQYKIKNIIFFENVLFDEISEAKEDSKNNKNISNNERTGSNLFQEGLIDDRDMKINDEGLFKDTNEDDCESDSDDDNSDRNKSKEKNINKSLPENNIFKSVSSINEDKKENISYDYQKKNLLKSSGFSD